MLRICIFLALIVLSVLSNFASSPLEGRQLRHYTVNDGLASNAIYSFCQDSKGRMWFGTIDGLHSFDGYNITEWRDEDVPTLGSVISTIVEDDRSRLWLGSGSGLALFDLKHEKFMELPVNPSSGVRIKTPVSGILHDSQRRVWFSTLGEGVFQYNPDNEILKQYPATTKINNDIVRCVMEDSSGHIWAGTNEGVALYNPTQDRFVPAGDPQTDRISVTSLFEDSSHNIWVGSRGAGLFMFDVKTDRLVSKLSPADSNSLLQVRDIVEWRPGELLLASDQGLTAFDTKTGEVTLVRANRQRENALNDNYLQTLFIDKEGALWIGTYFGGVNYVVPTERMFRHFYNVNTNLGAQIVSVFAEADNGNLWIGSDDAGVFHWNRKTNNFTDVRGRSLGSGSAYKNIHSLLQADGKLFVGMYLGGLDILDLKTGALKNYTVGKSPRSLYSSSIYSMLQDSYGEIWIGTAEGLNRYCPATDDFERIYEVHPADIGYLMEDKKGYLWACTTNKGVFRLDRKTGEWVQFSSETDEPDKEPPIPTNSIVTAECDENGNLWVGTDGGGLLKFDYESGKFTREPLPENVRVVNKIIAYKDQLWLGTSKGLYCYTPKDSRLFSYNKDSGLQGNVFLPNSGLMIDGGTIFMGGINGFNEFNPDKITHRYLKPEVILTDFQIFNHPVEIGAEDSPLTESITYSNGITLDHTQRMFSFKVAPLSYINPSHNRFLYKLEGFEKDWNEATPLQSLTYTNLPAGSYVFKVRTSDGNGGWNDDALSFPVKVLPPWWLSTPMIILYIVLGVGCLLLLYYHFMNKQKEKMRKLADQKDRELYQSKIEFFTHIVHEIRTPLTLILSPLENLLKSDGAISDCRSQLTVMDRNGKRLLNLVNHLMDFRKMESGAMKLFITDVDIRERLEWICQNYVLTAALKNLKVTVEVPESPCVAKVDKEAFTQIVNNLLSNALKFSKSEIDISLVRLPEGAFRLSVKNNGPAIPPEEQEKIFTPFYQIAENRPTDNIGTGLGLLLVKRYAKLMGTDVEVRSGGDIGAEFIIDFQASADGVVPDADNLPDTEKSDSEEAEAPETVAKERLLIVDDNAEMLAFLNELLSPHYDVECAGDAEEAFVKLESYSPDLIVSDVMMPGIDGMEFCRRLKQDINTSHIPVVLLTAKVEDSDFVTGFDSGADLYVTKPFSTDVIKAQIRSLLANRERLRERFVSDPEVIEELVPHSSIDKEFFDRIKGIIVERMTDPEFSVDVLAREMAISRTGLFTKLKAITGMTPNDYIRLIRLQKAAELLETTNMRVNEVCWQVGFSSRSHFAKCFQTQFGVSPSEYKGSLSGESKGTGK